MKMTPTYHKETLKAVIEFIGNYQSPFKEIDLQKDYLAEWALIEGGATKGVNRAKEDIINHLTSLEGKDNDQMR